jgi:predicted acyl esterase
MASVDLTNEDEGFMGGIRLDKNTVIPVRDGVELRADVFRGEEAEPAPVILTLGPYGKDIHFEDFNPAAFATVEERGRYMNWETVNPEWWVPRGYVVIRVDSRGTGQSPGRMELQSPQEYRDLFDVIEWAADQPWSSGNVALMGISYYSMNQWPVAAMRPRGLTAIVPWEGASDLYRELWYHGGILSNGFTDAWYPRQILGNQYGLGDADPKATLPGNVDLPAQMRQHPLYDEFFQERAPDFDNIEVPLLSAGNWGGFALHLRGNIEGYLAAGSTHKWLEVHSGNHFAPFYSSASRAYQQRFLDHFLKGADNGWDQEPPVKLFIRDSAGGQFRYEQEWPLARTQWTRLYLDVAGGALISAPPSQSARADYQAMTGGIDLVSEPMTEDLELTGPSKLNVWVESSTQDLDVFVTVNNIDPAGRVLTFEDASGMPGPVVKGWQRASHRQLDPVVSTPYRPVLTHRRQQLLEPGTPVHLEVEISPTSMVFEKGHRLGLSIRSYDVGEKTRFWHDDPEDRSPERFEGTNTILAGGEHDSYLLMPIIPQPTA